MNIQNFRKTIFVAIVVSLGSQIYLDVFIEGFIIALSVVMLAVFLYCYEELHPAQIAVLAGVFSPLFRMAVLVLTGQPIKEAAILATPDIVFFAWYGILYCLIFQAFRLVPKNMKTFPLVIAICDFSANMAEILVRQIVYQTEILSLSLIGTLTLVAVVRTCLIQVIIIAIESYSSLLLREEHNKEYKRLLVLTSIFEGEIYLMNKNADAIERIMKNAFTLYKDMEKVDILSDYKARSLDISKDAHEIKNDYLRTIAALKENFMAEQEACMEIKDLVNILKADIHNQIRVNRQKITFTTKVKSSFLVKRHYELMSIFRNLMINSVEAIGSQRGEIQLSIFDREDFHVILIKDNGPGIDCRNLDYIFAPGFSTKYNEQTGDINRGVGLSLVQDYVENIFSGTVGVKSEKGIFTEFEITIPKEQEE